MTDLEKFEAAFAALPPLPEEVRTTILVLWQEVQAGNLDLPKFQYLLRENRGQPGSTAADALVLQLVEELIARSAAVRPPPWEPRRPRWSD